MINKIVIRYFDGRIKKGTTHDFSPNQDIFHIIDKDNGEYQEINIKDLKAVFFVKDYEGNSKYQEKEDIDRVGLGKKIKVHFQDGESLVGYTQGYSRDRAAFMLFPSDPNSNNERAYVIAAATDSIDFV